MAAAAETGQGSDSGSRGWRRWRKVTRTSRSLKSVVDGGWSLRTAPPLADDVGLAYALKAALERNPPSGAETSGGLRRRRTRREDDGGLACDA